MFTHVPASRPLDLEDGIISTSSHRDLEAVTSSLSSSHLLVLEAPEGDVGTLVATRLAQSMLHSTEALNSDVSVAVPEKDRWSISEVETLIIAPSTFVPTERNMVVVASADRMDPSSSEHLLKTIEEPTSDSLFIFVVQDRSLLLSTILGRAGAVVRVDLADHADRVEGLVRLGLPRDEALEVTNLVGTNVTLANAYARMGAGREEVLLDIRTAFNAPLRTATPSQAATDLMVVLERLSALSVATVAPGRPQRKPSSSSAKSPQAKAALRTLVRRLVGSWRSSLSQEVSAAQGPVAYQRVVTALTALDQSEVELLAYAPPSHVLAALFSRCA